MGTIGIKIVYAGNGSSVGHMYVTFKNGDGSLEGVYGHYPEGVSSIKDLDAHENKKPGAEGYPDYSRDFTVSIDSYTKALDTAKAAERNKGDPSKPWGLYDPFSNSCVDFAWWILREAGIRAPTDQFEGYFWPKDNRVAVDDYYYNYFRRPEFNRELRRGWDTAKAWTPPRDPLILDLDGDGLETVGLSANVFFDHDGDRILTRTGWAGRDDALLVWDRNANGAVDSGAELFGDFTPLPLGALAPNGFAALAALDANGDGAIDARDPDFAQLRVWRDASQDGASQGGELTSLEEAGITSLQLGHSPKNQSLSNGNTLAREGRFTRADGATGGMGEFHLATDTLNTKFAEAVEVPDALKTLPTMQGAGNVRELRQAAAMSGQVQTLLAQFQTATTRSEQRALLEPLLTAWAGTSNLAKSLEERTAGSYRIRYEALGNEQRSRHLNAAALDAAPSTTVGSSTALMTDRANPLLSEHYRHLIDEWSRRLHVLEAFNGQYFFNLPQQKSQTPGANFGLSVSPGNRTASGAAAHALEAYPTLHVHLTPAQLESLQAAYDSLTEGVYASLVLQTRLKPYLDQVELVIDDNGLRLDATRLNQMLLVKSQSDPENYLADLLDLDRHTGRFLADTNWQGLYDFDTWVERLPPTVGIVALLDEFEVRVLSPGNDVSGLTHESDIALGGEGNDTLYGHNGNDRLFGQGGNDLQFGGNGDDLLSGGAGDDTLSGDAGADTYVFGRGAGHDRIIDRAEGGVQRDTVRFLGLVAADIRVTAVSANNLTFTIVETGETLKVPSRYTWWDPTGVGQYVFADGTVWKPDDALRATVASATDGDDSIQGSPASDSLSGLAGHDTLVGNAGDDVMDGGAGNDTLTGSAGGTWTNGNDTYLFGRGDGHDLLIDGDYTAGTIDTLRFKAGVALADVRFTRNGEDLVLALRDTNDQVTIQRYFDEDWRGDRGPYLIERIAFDDGTTLSFADVQRIVFSGSEYADFIIGSRAADHLMGQDESDTLQGHEGDDLLEGGDGDDLVLGDSGRDTLDGGAGNDVLRGGAALDAWNRSFEVSGEGDAYRFGLGDGHDTLIEDSWGAGQIDRIELKASVTPSGLKLERVRTLESGQQRDDLRLTLPATGETLTARNHFDESGRHAIEEIVFEDGTVWRTEDIRTQVLRGGEGPDDLRGFEGRDDMILGGGGNDRLFGLTGNDVLDGGTGDDLLEGGAGSDTYGFGRGRGHERVVESESATAQGNRVVLDAEVAPGDVWVRKSGRDLVLGIIGTPDTLTLKGAAGSTDRSWLAAVLFADGTTWDYEALKTRSAIGTIGNDRLEGFEGVEQVFDGGPGDDDVVGGTGGDLYVFGLGDGEDALLDRDSNLGHADVLRFKPGVAPQDLVLARQGPDLVISILDTNDAVTIKGFYRWEAGSWIQRIERFDFADGTTWTADDVVSRATLAPQLARLQGTSGPDTLVGNEADNHLAGLAGDDGIEAGVGNDTLVGGSGADSLHGGTGNDVLIGFLQIEGDAHTGFAPTPTAQNYLDQAGNALVNGLSHGMPGFGEQVIPPNDDGSSFAIDITEVFGREGLNFFGSSYTALYVNNNGNITFGRGLGAYTPARIGAGSAGIIAPFWADVDTRGGPTSTSPGGNSQGSNLVYYDLDTDNGVFTATWDDVGYFSDHTDRQNAFQVQLVNRGGGDFDIVFRYEAINWTTGDVSGGRDGLGGQVARAGFSAGTGDPAHYFELQASGHQDAVLELDSTEGNTGRPGVHVFHVRNGRPSQDNGEAIRQGGTAANHLHGGPGDDLYIVDTTGDAVVEATGEGNDQIIASVSFALPDHVERLTLTGARPINGFGNALDNVMAGNAAGNTLDGADGDDDLDGGAGDDTILGGAGTDTLRGGTGRDHLYGEAGADTYRFARGDGEVFISDSPEQAWAGQAPNVLAFGAGISSQDLRFSELAGDLVIEVSGQPGDRLVLRNHSAWRATHTRSIDIIRFADGQEIIARDVLESAADETLSTLVDGAVLAGATGSDTYRIHRGAGSTARETTIREAWRSQDLNRIELTGQIDTRDLLLEFDGRDLVLRLSPEGDTIRFAGFDPRTPGMRAPVAAISLPAQGVELSFDDLLARGVRILGTPGSDMLTGTELADWIEGRGANDTMMGGAGDDFYVIDAGTGSSTLMDSESGGASNVLVLPAGTSLDDVRLSHDSQGFLVLELAGTGHQVRLAGFDPQDPMGPRAVSRLRFGIDGHEITYEELLARGLDIVGTEDDDSLQGTTLTDRIRGAQGNDLLEATPGGDTLAGEGGDDTYVVKIGDGQVTIDDLSNPDAGNVLRLGPGINPNTLRNNLRFEPDGAGGHVMLLPYGGEADVVRLRGFHPGNVHGSRAVERFEFADGTVVDYATLVSWTFVVEGDSRGNALTGTDASDRLYGYDGDDVMDSGEGHDVLTGGMGRDVLRGGAGRDAYVLGLGDGEDVIEDGLDGREGNVITFGEGIAHDDVRIEVDGPDCVIAYGPDGDAVRVRNHSPADKDGGTAIDTLEFADGSVITLREFMNRAPGAASPLGDQVAPEDASFSLVLPHDLFSDADGDEVFIHPTVSGFASQPDWLRYDAATRTLHGTPSNQDVGEFDVILQAQDALGASTLQSLRIVVQNTNDAPRAAYPIANHQAQKDTPFTFTVATDAFDDEDAGDALTLSATRADGSPLPAWLAFDPVSRTFNGVPAQADVGALALRLTASDLAGTQASQTFELAVTAGGDNPAPISAPITAPDAARVTEDQKLVAWGNVLTNDRDDQGKSLSVTDPGVRHGQYGVLTLLRDGGYGYVLNETSAAVQRLGAGVTMTERFDYTSSNGVLAAKGELTVTVAGTNDRPELARALGDVQVKKNRDFSWRLPADAFIDPDRGDHLTYTATLANGKPLPSWLQFNSATLTFSGDAPNRNGSELDIRIVARDGHGDGSLAEDVFRLRLGPKTVLPTGSSQQEGRGHESYSAPTRSASRDDYSHRSAPARHGQDSRVDDPLARFIDGLQRSTQDRWIGADSYSSRTKPANVEAQWTALIGALNQLDVERQSAPAWSQPSAGADMTGLGGLIQRTTPDSRSTTGGPSDIRSSTSLKPFTGLREGLMDLPW